MPVKPCQLCRSPRLEIRILGHPVRSVEELNTSPAIEIKVVFSHHHREQIAGLLVIGPAELARFHPCAKSSALTVAATSPSIEIA